MIPRVGGKQCSDHPEPNTRRVPSLHVEHEYDMVENCSGSPFLSTLTLSLPPILKLSTTHTLNACHNEESSGFPHIQRPLLHIPAASQRTAGPR